MILNHRFRLIGRYDRLQDPKFPSSDSNPLPEDFEMREVLARPKGISRKTGFLTKSLLIFKWDVERPKYREFRSERVLWLARQLAKSQQWIIYDPKAKNFPYQ